VKSSEAKPSPVTVTDVPPVCGAFRMVAERAGESKLNTDTSVPTRALTVKKAEGKCVDSTFDKHCTLVVDDHAVVTQIPPPIDTEAVKACTPKLRPVTVTDEPPLRTAFDCVAETTGASKLYNCRLVPAIAPTVTAAKINGECISGVSSTTVVDDVHPRVPGSKSVTKAEAVNRLAPKFRPVTVTDAPPVLAEFRCAAEAMGASNVKESSCVPTAAATDTTDTGWDDDA
jgi:hypothetical protein